MTRATGSGGARAAARAWRERLLELCEAIRGAAVARPSDAAVDARRARPAMRGVGDVSFGLDVVAEEAVARWLARVAREEPLSLLTEERGWQHVGPDGRGGTTELAGFDHGGPRIALDPVDGTRNLMFELRSAWTVVSFAGAGGGQPRLSELAYGLVAEIPCHEGARVTHLEALAGEGGARTWTLDACERDAPSASAPAAHDERAARTLRADGDARPDHGYFPFFAYHPAMRPAVARLAARFFERIERHEAADLAHCYDDQYISSAGQLVHVARGAYRMVVEARHLLASLHGRATQVAKPYDMAGAIVVARAAGCVVETPEGGALDFPIDATTPVDFAAYANRATADRLRPHLAAAIAAEREAARAGGAR